MMIASADVTTNDSRMPPNTRDKISMIAPRFCTRMSVGGHKSHLPCLMLRPPTPEIVARMIAETRDIFWTKFPNLMRGSHP